MFRQSLAPILTAVVLCAPPGCGKTDAPPPNATEISEFFAAVQDGDTEIVTRLLKAKPGLAETTNANGQTALQIATQQGNDDLADALRKRGAK